MVKKNIFKGIIICGGQSSRMGSDKSLLFWNGVPFYKHIVIRYLFPAMNPKNLIMTFQSLLTITSKSVLWQAFLLL